MSRKTSIQLRVDDIMTRNPICIGMGNTIRELAELLVENEISGVPVIDAQECVVGVVSKTDLLNRCMEGSRDARTSFFVNIAGALDVDLDLDDEEVATVEEFMSTDPVTAMPDEAVAEVARRMAHERIHRLIVVDENNQVLGIVTSLDLLNVFPE